METSSLPKPETVYVKVCIPINPADGVKVPSAVTPVPDQVPPVGVPESTTGALLSHSAWSEPAETLAEGKTVIVMLSEPWQPFWVTV